MITVAYPFAFTRRRLRWRITVFAELIAIPAGFKQNRIAMDAEAIKEKFSGETASFINAMLRKNRSIVENAQNFHATN